MDEYLGLKLMAEIWVRCGGPQEKARVLRSFSREDTYTGVSPWEQGA